jgi:predicted CoA-substrate-specific enzyme activase
VSPYYAGIDVGSWSTKAVIIDSEVKVLGKHLVRSGVDFTKAAEMAFDEALAQAKVAKEDVKMVISTGYGRKNVQFADENRTEIMCHGFGAHYHFPEAATIIDIGGQDNKVIRVNGRGRSTNFVLNRKCAAGTGAFLDEMALRLNVRLEDLNGLAERSTKRIKLGSFCTVFTGTEILKLVQQGEKVEDIAWGLYLSVATRISEMAPLEGTVILTGGVIAHNPILKDIFKQEFGVQCRVPPDPQYIGALGAALVALTSSRD